MTIKSPNRMAALLLVLLSAPAFAGKPEADKLAKTKAVMEASFAAKGQATMARLDQDETQQLCSRYAPGQPPAAAIQKIIADNQAAIQYPADGQYLGDWQSGEKIAQEGKGMQFSDDPSKPSGGNCYACHQLSKSEIAYGTIGPSLLNYGKLRGNSEPILKYTWAKIYDPKATMPCSNMPRFGHMNILTQAQMKDVMALLFDPASPVNQ